MQIVWKWVGVPSIVRHAGVAVVAASAIAMLQLASPPAAHAKPEYAAQTGLPCGQCHVSPAGGGKLKSFGEKFKANGYKLKK